MGSRRAVGGAHGPVACQRGPASIRARRAPASLRPPATAARSTRWRGSAPPTAEPDSRATSRPQPGRSRRRPADRAGHGDRLPRRLRRLATEQRPQGSAKGTTPTHHDQSRPAAPRQDGKACLDPAPLSARSAQCRDDARGVVDQISGRPQAVERQKAPRTTENCRDVSALVEARFQLKAPARQHPGERSRRSTRARTRSSASSCRAPCSTARSPLDVNSLEAPDFTIGSLQAVGHPDSGDEQAKAEICRVEVDEVPVAFCPLT